MQAVNRGHIIDSCPSSVERPDHNNSENYSLKFLCEAGGLQSIANDISPDERSFKRMNTVKKSFETMHYLPFGGKNKYLMTLWAAEDIEEGEEIFHEYGAGY